MLASFYGSKIDECLSCQSLSHGARFVDLGVARGSSLHSNILAPHPVVLATALQ
jgi:hypothetical protein